ncbi:MAG: DUF192 domain-containing protein [Candidatus Saccharimonadales bacterium]
MKAVGKRAYWKLLVGVVAAGVLLVLAIVLISGQEATAPVANKVSLTGFKTETVNTTATRNRGLGGHASLGSNEAMVFDFSDGANGQCFWMKDMMFSIDIVWLDENNQVAKIADNVSPATYPKSFCAEQNPKYVIELAAGRASELGLQVGSQVKL